MNKSQAIPTHLGFIVDGNRRWAREKGLPTLHGHKKGMDKVELVIDCLLERGIKYASFYVFSTENWSRSQEEVDYLMELEKTMIKSLTKKMKKKGIRCLLMGSPVCPRPDIIENMQAAVKETEDGENMTVCFCFNYGGHREIADATSSLIAERIAKARTLGEDADLSDLSDLTKVSIEDFAKHLYHPDVPPCDMIIRTSGEQRLSNFLLWRAAYSELLFLDRYFPDMDEAAVDEILAEFASRHRRFGK